MRLEQSSFEFYCWMNNNLSRADYQVFFLKSLFWLILTGIGFLLALLGFFYAEAVWVIAIIIGLWIFYSNLKNEISFPLSWEMLIVCSLIIIMAIVFSFNSTPTVFSGRDQGSISEAAIQLAQNHTFEFSTPVSQEFFNIYGKGRALNFPGFYYTAEGNLITQFPLAYVVWLALFYAIFGLTGFAVANAILLSIFLISFYLLTRLFLKTLSALPTMLFAITSFAFMWFTKYTLSENMAIALLWLSILALMVFLKNFQKLNFAVFLASAFLLALTRIEGLAFLAVSIIIIFSSAEARQYLKEKPMLRFFLPAGIFLAVFIANAIKDLNFYRELAKALLSGLDIIPKAQLLGFTGDLPLPAFYFEKIFGIYGMIGFFVVGAVSVAYLLFRKEFYKLIPFFIILPTFIYFFDSHISNDHPWMLRRFMFSILPAAIFYSGLLIGRQFEEKSQKIRLAICGFFIILLIGGNLPAFSKYLFFSENKQLLEQVQTLSKNFSKNDLVLIDRETTGDGWSMISGPMNSIFHKNSVYFLNTSDLMGLNLQKFDNIYLITPDHQLPNYQKSIIGSRLTFFKDYSFKFSKLDSLQDDSLEITTSLPGIKEYEIKGKILKVTK